MKGHGVEQKQEILAESEIMVDSLLTYMPVVLEVNPQKISRGFGHIAMMIQTGFQKNGVGLVYKNRLILNINEESNINYFLHL